MSLLLSNQTGLIASFEASSGYLVVLGLLLGADEPATL
jgi:hypothetical protein